MTKQSLSNHELATRTYRVLDLGPRQARLVLLAGIMGIVLVVVESLVGNRPETIGVDKVLHFGGYTTLAAALTLALPPRRFVPALVALAAAGLLIELLQPLNMRMFDWADALANTVGILVGAAAGLGTRLAYGYLRTELAEREVQHSLLSFAPGEIIVREGQRIEQFYVIKSGTVALTRRQKGTEVLVSRATAGETFGLLEEILREPLVTTAVAETAVALYQTDYDQLIAAAGGRDQPLAAVFRDLATDLREAWERIAVLQLAAGASTEPDRSSALRELHYSRQHAATGSGRDRG